MARFYAHYQNSTVSGLETVDASHCYQRKTVNTTLAATARTSMINTRATLSASFYASIDAVNRDGGLGIVVPADAYTNNGTTFSGPNLYTNTAAVWPADPRVRPTSDILIISSGAVSPTDSFRVPTSEYDAARQAVQDYYTAITGGSPYLRLGRTPWRTLASVWHDHDLTYFAWDDFTPGRISNFAVQVWSGVGDPEELRFTGNYDYLNDENPDGRVEFIATLTGPTTYSINTLLTPSSGSFLYDWKPNGNSSVTPGSYTLSCTVRLRDAVIITNFGNPSTVTDSYTFPI